MRRLWKKINNTVLKSLQIRIILVIIVFMFIPVLILLNYNFRVSEEVIQEKTSRLVVDNLRQIGNQIENTCLDIIKLNNVLNSNAVILDGLMQVSGNMENSPSPDNNHLSTDDFIRISRIEQEISYAKANIFFNYSSDVLIFDSSGYIYNILDHYDGFHLRTEYMKTFRDEAWHREMVTENQNILWIAPFTYGLGDVLGSEISFISAVRAVKESYTSENILGFVMVNVGEEHFRNILKNNTSGGVISLLNEKGQVIFSSDPQEAQKHLDEKELYALVPKSGDGYFFDTLQNKKFMINYYPLERFGWILISANPYEEVMKEISVLKTKIYFINLFVFIVFLALCLGFILYVTAPLKKTMEKLRGIKIGNYQVETGGEAYIDDLNVMIKSIDYMIRRMEELVTLVIEEQKQEHRLKYEALRAQIHPHFLFNTLNTIKWSAMMSGAGNVSRMITSLGKLLETSMSKGEDEIRLKEEMELVEAYMCIQNARNNGAYTLHIHMDPACSDLKVLKLILQPIVENSIIHGFRDREWGGCITVQAALDQGKVALRVEDNGAGMETDTLERIRTDMEERKRFSGIGIANVHERIRLRYGNDYGLTIRSQPGGGTTVTILLPAIR